MRAIGIGQEESSPLSLADDQNSQKLHVGEKRSNFVQEKWHGWLLVQGDGIEYLQTNCSIVRYIHRSREE